MLQQDPKVFLDVLAALSAYYPLRDADRVTAVRTCLMRCLTPEAEAKRRARIRATLLQRVAPITQRVRISEGKCAARDEGYREAVLNAWFAGEPLRVIGARHGVSPQTISHLVTTARSQGDRRATVRRRGRRRTQVSA
jgi:hypothetical protein